MSLPQSILLLVIGLTGVCVWHLRTWLTRFGLSTLLRAAGMYFFVMSFAAIFVDALASAFWMAICSTIFSLGSVVMQYCEKKGRC